MKRKPAPTTARKPQDPRGFRTRVRADGSVRCWWEPRAEDRKLGFAAVDLDADRMTWSRRQAEDLNEKVAAAKAEGPKGRAKVAAGRAGARTISALIASYRTSPHFTGKLAEKTRDSYGKLLLQIEEKWGVYRVAEFDKSVINTWYEALYAVKGPRMAQALVRMMSILFARAEVLRWRPENSNPCWRLQIVTPDPRQRAGAAEELAAIIAGAQALGLPGMEMAIRLAIYQGQRQTDIRAVTRGAFALVPRLFPGETRVRKVWVWTFVRSKKKNAGGMIVHPDVVPQLRALLADAGTAGMPRRPEDPLILDPATGRAYDEFLFNKRWHAILAWAAKPEGGDCPGISGLQFRDLRRTFGVLARAGGASKDDVGDVLGNSAAVNPILGETYMPASFDTASRAVAAVKSKTPRRGRGS